MSLDTLGRDILFIMSAKIFIIYYKVDHYPKSHVPNAKNHVSNVKKFPVVAGSEHVTLRSHWIDDPDPQRPPAPEAGEYKVGNRVAAPLTIVTLDGGDLGQGVDREVPGPDARRTEG